MKKYFYSIFILVGGISVLCAQPGAADFVRTHYMKKEVYITMRDSIKLFTAIYIPKDISKDNKYPVLMQRTCYSVAPYGQDNYKRNLGPSPYLMKDKYIFVYQDVRGRYMSEGVYVHMPPYIADKTKNTNIDESSDTYDTVEWLVQNIENNNGRVGQWGISYPGYYTAAGAMCEHPALRASSPQAPIGDFFFDDFHHNGAFLLSYWKTFPLFGVQKTKPESQDWFSYVQPNTPDGYEFLYRLGTAKGLTEKYYKDNFFWQDVIHHPDYDAYWKSRSLKHKYRNNVRSAVMVVGGWFDAEDLHGPLNIYRDIEKGCPDAYNTLVMTPFGHGRWSRETGPAIHNDIYFGDSVATFYQKEIEFRFFRHFLKGSGDFNSGLPEAYMFNTGKNVWRTFDYWPVKTALSKKLYLNASGRLTWGKGAQEKKHKLSFWSDPNKPVPYVEDRSEMLRFTPYNYMSADQRFAAARPDVLAYQTEVLTEDVTLAGPIQAMLQVATSATDADWVVKVIDVYPDTALVPGLLAHRGIIMGGYQQMVRSEVMRGRFRKSFEKPEPFKSNVKTLVPVTLQDVLHTFKKGHRIMVQIQSTWFPFIDRNPQKYVPNIYKADVSDFVPAWHSVFGDSFLEVSVLSEN